MQWLKTGKKDNGAVVTPNERFEYHNLLNDTFAKSIAGIQVRAQYAELLTSSKQYATAQDVLRERIKMADELPLKLYQSEMGLLADDMNNHNLSRSARADIGTMFAQIGGTTTSKDDGLLYMPIACRKQAVYFYTSASNSTDGTGIFKADQAIEMINETRAAEMRLYGIDLTKNPNQDPGCARWRLASNRSHQKT